MLFEPQKYALPDISGKPFISSDEITGILNSSVTVEDDRIAGIIAEALRGKRLSLQQTACLLNADSDNSLKMIFNAARRIKKEIYGDRIVIFAPLYIGNNCVNNCLYCGFRAANQDAVRLTLSKGEIIKEVSALETTGQKRLILVFGEHPAYSPKFIAECIRTVYHTQKDHDRINRVNINAAPFDTEGFGIIARAGIGTYQIFQETYDPARYALFHSSGKKRDYDYRLTALDRAMEAGIDDVGLGVLFGLGDWKFEVMSLLRHVNHLESCFSVSPHTISFPRIRNTSNIDRSLLNPVPDDVFQRIIAILQIAVPYTGLILTARESPELRDELIEYGVSQIDAGSNLEIGGYTSANKQQVLEREQFQLMDCRSLEETVCELIEKNNIPSFCTACYRKGRTGEHFMTFSTRGHIKHLCTPNALITFAEYLEDYAGETTRINGWRLIDSKLCGMSSPQKEKTTDILARVRNGERDILL